MTIGKTEQWGRQTMELLYVIIGIRLLLTHASSLEGFEVGQHSRIAFINFQN